METTIIRLGGVSDSNMVVRSATFEEAFGDYSEAKGRGRARRKKRRLERIQNRREVRTERRKLKDDRQQERIGRRANRKRARQAMRTEQQSARMERRGARLDMRQQRQDARQMRKDTRTQGDEGRENYMAEQELYREGLNPEIDETQEQGGYAPEQGGGYAEQGGYAPEQGGGYAEEWGSAPQGGGGYSEEGGYAPQGGGGYAEEDYYGDQDSGEGAYGDDNTYEGDYVQEEDEFNDDSYFNVEGMDGKAIVSPYVKDTSQKLKNNAKAFAVLSQKRKNIIANKEQVQNQLRRANPNENIDSILARLENQIARARKRIVELNSNLDDYCNADGNPMERKRRRREVNLALRRRLRKRNRRNQYAGSEVPVDSDLSPQFGANRIEVPSASNFDAYSDLGRPVIVEGQETSTMNDYSDDIYGDFEPTTIEMQSSFSGVSSNNKTMVSIAIGVGVGALALYFAKRKGLI